MKARALPCFYFDKVPCSHRKCFCDSQSKMIYKCVKCPHYARWKREMDEEDEKMMDEIDRIHQNPEAYLRGELD